MNKAANEMSRATRAFAGMTRAFADFNSTYRRSIEIEKWQRRSTRLSISRRRRWVARYITWCLVREAKRAIYMRRRP